jgi:hypothetical protein
VVIDQYSHFIRRSNFSKSTPNPDGPYDDIAKSFAMTLDRMSKCDKEDGNEQRRQITLHSFRRFL